ncbi:DUF1178 family protein [Propionivibrio sp.]|uniref:DUF1178 family protein n=1 Tax=Propionivibrio sp. TaxID=2212460 RepID=UPI00272ED424|nr:DUF1178 family protein [Propionivibrio sp.]
MAVVDLIHLPPDLLLNPAETALLLMIIFDLTCNNDHGFEGWFQSAESFEQQLLSGLVSCPYCGSVEIRRVPSAVHVGKTSTPAENAGERVTAVSPQGELLGVYQKLLSALVAGSEDVGREFASEARKIHYMEAPARSIRGQATTEEFDSLREEGIEVLHFPVLNKDELN